MKYKKEWTLFLEGFRARTSALLARVRESAASNPGYSSSLPAYVAEFDRGTSSWRTRQRLLLGGWEQFSGNFPKWGMMRSGVVYQRQMSELHTAGTDGGVSAETQKTGGWGGTKFPTPMASDGKMLGGLRSNLRRDGFSLGVYTRIFHSPEQSRFIKSHKRIIKPKEAVELMQRHPEMKISGGKLNPDWVEWLMGWPIGWTDLKPLGTDRFLPPR